MVGQSIWNHTLWVINFKGLLSEKGDGLSRQSCPLHRVPTHVFSTSCALSTVMAAPLPTRCFSTPPSGSVNQITPYGPGKLTIGWDGQDTGLPGS